MHRSSYRFVHHVRPSRFARFLGLAALLALLGGAWQVPACAASRPALDRWETLRAQDLRVAAIAYRLSVANARLCPAALAAQPGFVLHALDQYQADDRQDAARRFGLGPYVGVMAVVAGSPAQRSGLAADDRLLAVNGLDLREAASASDGAPSRESVERVQRILAEEMAKGAVTLSVSGASGPRDLHFTAEAGCASDVELATGGEVNAWADGTRVVIGDGILGRCGNDGDLALVIAHELAHNLLHHARALAAEGSAGRRLALTGSGSSAMREREEEADRLGVRLASAAAFDLADAASFLAGLLEGDGAGNAAGTHPAPARRLALLRAAIAAAAAGRAL